MSGFRLLVIADSHYASCAADVVSLPKRRCELGCQLVRRAIADADHHGGFDALALMGDLIDNGNSPRAEDDLREVRDAVLAACGEPGRTAAGDVPLLVIPGNHDGDAERMLAIFEHRCGLHEIGPYRFVTFADAYVDEQICTRSESDRRALRDLADKDGPPIIVLQHNPMNPLIDRDDYPFMLTNRTDVMADYSAAGLSRAGSRGVMLSISGHYHPGQPLNTADGVMYFTAPAICEAPFQYAVITLRGREVDVEIRPLTPEE